MKKRSFLKGTAAMVLAAMVAAGATGCGGGGQSADAGSGSANTDSGNSAKETTINVMVWDRGNAAPGTTTEDNALTQWIKDQVKEQFNINVEYTAVPRSESDDKLNIMMSGGTAPDIVFTYDQALFYNYANSGALADLSGAYDAYGQNIQKYCEEAQTVGTLGDSRFAVMKQRGEEHPRHEAYIRKDWLDQLGMEMPKTKAELGEYLRAVKENNLGGTKTIPWAMSGRSDTEKMYLNFVGSYVDFADDKEAYTYNEGYIAVAPGAKDGIKQLNEWYNEGLITKDFPTDTAEDVYMSDISNGYVGFLLDDISHAHDSFAVLNTSLGKETFAPIQCFELSDGTSYRTPFEYRYAMFVMVPSASQDKVEACMKYLNWMADLEVAVNIRYTPDHTVNELGVAVEPTDAEKEAKGYPGTCDDLCIMNLNFDWVSDVDVLAQTMYDTQEQEWASVDWYKDYYNVGAEGKFRYPTFAYISTDEQTYGADVKTRLLEFVYTCICAPTDQFEATYEAGYNELINAGLQKILDGRASYYDSLEK